VRKKRFVRNEDGVSLKSSESKSLGARGGVSRTHTEHERGDNQSELVSKRKGGGSEIKGGEGRKYKLLIFAYPVGLGRRH